MVRFESEEEEEKNNDSENFFFYAREKAQNILHSFRFFLSLSFSFSPVVVVVVACHHPEREREREVRISSKTLFVSRFAKHTCALSLFFRCSEYFLFFFFRESG